MLKNLGMDTRHNYFYLFLFLIFNFNSRTRDGAIILTTDQFPCLPDEEIQTNKSSLYSIQYPVVFRPANQITPINSAQLSESQSFINLTILKKRGF